MRHLILFRKPFRLFLKLENPFDSTVFLKSDTAPDSHNQIRLMQLRTWFWTIRNHPPNGTQYKACLCVGVIRYFLKERCALPVLHVTVCFKYCIIAAVRQSNAGVSYSPSYGFGTCTSVCCRQRCKCPTGFLPTMRRDVASFATCCCPPSTLTTAQRLSIDRTQPLE
jgi:hypothetical protein